MSGAWYRWDGDDLVFSVHAQPRARTDGFAEMLDNAIKLRLTAPPVDGKANARLKAVLAGYCQVAKSAVQIESGETGRRKRVRIRSPKRLPPGITR